ncbi:MAG: hypothetical protein IJI35_15575 [Kiritimatiellae bacterium]|nr:hypothetical protein [Kiritimatiellia bacterium]
MSNKMPDSEWYELVKAGEDAGWKLVWERVVEPESKSMRSAEMMRRYSITDGDLMGLLYDEMIGRKKIELFRGEGSFEGWLRRYVRGFILAAAPNSRETSIEGAFADDSGEAAPMDIPALDQRTTMRDIWVMTHECFYELWLEDPERAYIHLLKTRFFLSSAEIKDFLEVSSEANVDQIFSRNTKFLRETWARRDNLKTLGRMPVKQRRPPKLPPRG